MYILHLQGILFPLSVKTLPGTLVFNVAKTHQFSALWHLKRILAAVCSFARRSAAPPKGMEREDGICDLTTLQCLQNSSMSCHVSLLCTRKKNQADLRLFLSIKQPLAQREWHVGICHSLLDADAPSNRCTLAHFPGTPTEHLKLK